MKNKTIFSKSKICVFSKQGKSSFFSIFFNVNINTIALPK